MTLSGCKSTADDLVWNQEAVGAAPTTLTKCAKTMFFNSSGFFKPAGSKGLRFKDPAGLY